jgi:hypothetical protein
MAECPPFGCVGVACALQAGYLSPGQNPSTLCYRDLAGNPARSEKVTGSYGARRVGNQANAPGEVCSRGGVLLASERLHGLDGGGADGGVKAEDQAH